MQVALARADHPGATLLLAQRPFRHDAGVGRAGRHAKRIAGAAALARVDVEHGPRAVLVAHGEGALVQFQLFHHVAVESGGGAGDLLALQHVKRRVQQNAIQVEADAAEIRPAHGEAGVEIVVRADAGQPLDRAQRIVGQHAGEVLGVVAAQHEGRRAILARRLEGTGLHLHGVGLVEGLGTENHFKVLGLSRVQVDGFLQQVVADGENAQHVIARRDAGDAKSAGGIGSGAVGASHQLHDHAGERLAATRVHDGAAHLGGRLGVQGGSRQQQEEDPLHWDDDSNLRPECPCWQFFLNGINQKVPERSPYP